MIKRDNTRGRSATQRFHVLGSVLFGVLAAVLFGPTSLSTGLEGSHSFASGASGPEPSQAVSGANGSERVPVTVAGATAVRGEDHLVEILSALRNRDSERATGAIDRWLEGGAESVEDLLRLIATDREDRTLDPALAVLLKRAVVDAEKLPAAFDPWTPTDIITQAIDLLGASTGNAAVLRGGLSGLGRHATAEQLVHLIQYQGGRGDKISDETHQVDTIRLMQDWAAGGCAGAEPQLDALLADPASTPLARSRAASLLLHRDWRLHAEKLVDQLDELEADSASALEKLGGDLRIQLSTFARYLDSAEQAEYLPLLADDPRAFRHAVDSITSDDALGLLATIDTSEMDEFHLATLELRAGTDRAIDAALSLLPILEDEPDFSAQLCVHRMIELGGALDAPVQAMLEGLFERRDDGGDPFWRAIGWQPQSLSDAQVEEAIVPWLYLSMGESHATRDLLVEHVQERFPNRYGDL